MQPVSIKARTAILVCPTLGPRIFCELICCSDGEYWGAGQGGEGDLSWVNDGELLFFIHLSYVKTATNVLKPLILH